MLKITPFLWFDGQAEEAANHYVSIFPNSRVLSVLRTGDAGPGPKGSVLTVAFTLDGNEITALNGGPPFKFSEAISFQVTCDTQEEVDYFWDKLTAGGDVKAQQCGWLKDRFGLSWQVVPDYLIEALLDRDIERSTRVMGAMMQMTRIDIGALQRARDGA